MTRSSLRHKTTSVALVMCLAESLTAASALATATPNEGVLAPLAAQVGGAMNVALARGDTIWLGVGPRVVSLDAQVPAAPNEIGRSDLLPSVVQDFALDPSRSLLWVVAGSWLIGLDVAEPARPAEVGRLALPREATRITLSDTDAWILVSDDTIQVVDVETATAAQLGATFDVPGNHTAVDIEAAGRFVAVLEVAVGHQGAEFLLDVFDTASVPPSRSSGALANGLYLQGSSQLEWRSGRLWARLGELLVALQVDRDGLAEVGRDELSTGGVAVAMAVGDDVVYVSYGSGWGDNFDVLAYDTANPSDVRALNEPHWVLGLYPGVFERAMAVAGDTVWVSSSGGYLTALDASAASALPVVGAYTTVGSVFDLDIDGDYLVAVSEQSVQTVDLHEPSVPVAAGLVHAGYHYIEPAAEDGSLALAIGGQSDMIFDMLHLSDTRDPGHPVPLFSTKVGESPWGTRFMARKGDVLALAGGPWEPLSVSVLDIADPAAPVTRFQFDPSGRPLALLLSSTHLFLVVRRAEAIELRVRPLDASGTEASLVLDGGIGSADVFADLDADRAYVLVQNHLPDARRGTQRLYTVDVSSPLSPVLAGADDVLCEPACDVEAMAYDTGYLFVGSGPTGLNGVVKLDVKGTQPVIAETLLTRTGVYGLEAASGYLYAATGSGGLNVFSQPDVGWGGGVPRTPAPTSEHTVTPRPSSTATELPSQTPTSGVIRWSTFLPGLHRP